MLHACGRPTFNQPHRLSMGALFQQLSLRLVEPRMLCAGGSFDFSDHACDFADYFRAWHIRPFLG